MRVERARREVATWVERRQPGEGKGIVLSCMEGVEGMHASASGVLIKRREKREEVEMLYISLNRAYRFPFLHSQSPFFISHTLVAIRL